jgi:hypothetical protein
VRTARLDWLDRMCVATMKHGHIAWSAIANLPTRSCLGEDDI